MAESLSSKNSVFSRDLLFFQYAEAAGLRILAFPCNQFGGQEPGTEAEIKEFAAARGATFDMVWAFIEPS